MYRLLSISLLLVVAHPVFQGPPFKTSLTATVQESTARDRCRDVVLTWRAHPAAQRYRVQVSTARDGAWGDAPAKTGCPRTSPTTTSFVDREPVEQPPPNGAARLFYRVVAIGVRGPLDTSETVPVELTGRTMPQHDLIQNK